MKVADQLEQNNYVPTKEAQQTWRDLANELIDAIEMPVEAITVLPEFGQLHLVDIYQIAMTLLDEAAIYATNMSRMAPADE